MRDTANMPNTVDNDPMRTISLVLALALLPGCRVAMQSCLEHVEEALDSHSDGDRTAILAALAVRLH